MAQGNQAPVPFAQLSADLLFVGGVALGKLPHNRHRLPFSPAQKAPEALELLGIQGIRLPAPVVDIPRQLVDGKGQIETGQVHTGPRHRHHLGGRSLALHNGVGGKGGGKLQAAGPIPWIEVPNLFQGLSSTGKQVPMVSGDFGQGHYAGIPEQGSICMGTSNINADQVQRQPSFYHRFAGEPKPSRLETTA